ncbi:hypothetical protein CUJ87_28740 [Paraburkholderia caledonica]|nr:hypothetical protein CUJ87_28740 [Paraburkholderia caledonica]
MPADVAGGDDTGEPDPARRRSAGQERRSRRSRLADLIQADESHAEEGAIAVSFAVVSRKRWPR